MKGEIGAVSDPNKGERSMAPIEDRSEHGIDFGLELGRPPGRWLGGRRVESGFEVELAEERGVGGGAEPELADEHGAAPPLLHAQPRHDVGQALVRQLGPRRRRRFRRICHSYGDLIGGDRLRVVFLFPQDEDARLLKA